MLLVLLVLGVARPMLFRMTWRRRRWQIPWEWTEERHPRHGRPDGLTQAQYDMLANTPENPLLGDDLAGIVDETGNWAPRSSV